MGATVNLPIGLEYYASAKYSGMVSRVQRVHENLGTLDGCLDDMRQDLNRLRFKVVSELDLRAE
jgi:hypothetical protein